ncbi:universal stress protein [Ornithinibacillus sp. 179-J 7C1 HS]|uniref:universal stress protein n=1 Tax=Ornithinibacillus sp. 179-J 7C1 HS TaxID=3142384 RepID=UPI0039A0CCD4
MEGFKQIVLAFDGSKYSVRALQTAEHITKLSGAKLTVVVVHEPSLDTTVTPGVVTGDGVQLYHPHIGALPPHHEGTPSEMNNTPLQDDSADKVIDDASMRLSKLTEVDYEILSGKPAEKIIEFAEEKDADLIIMGNRGLSGIKKLVMGSVSKKVLTEASSPVLVVK